MIINRRNLLNAQIYTKKDYIRKEKIPLILFLCLLNLLVKIFEINKNNIYFDFKVFIFIIFSMLGIIFAIIIKGGLEYDNYKNKNISFIINCFYNFSFIFLILICSLVLNFNLNLKKSMILLTINLVISVVYSIFYTFYEIFYLNKLTKQYFMD